MLEQFDLKRLQSWGCGNCSHEGDVSPRSRGVGTAPTGREHCPNSVGEIAMKASEAAADACVRAGIDSIRASDLGIEVPNGHIGPVLLSETGRTVWWTGRVAIGLRYQPPQYSESNGQSARWLQDVLLRCGH